ncbi:hypothetical protein BSKO_07599 [Bryopsis sp. KO-2023]|nr:hypothetical protein BSKO_07599 [Bryopsis sp. KO-2023]
MKELKNSPNPNPLEVSDWWQTFVDPKLERSFEQLSVADWIRIDRRMYMMAPFIAVVIILTSDPKDGFVHLHHALVVLFVLILPMFFHRMIVARSSWYEDNRGKIMMWLKPLSAATAACLVPMQRLSGTWIAGPGIFARIFSKSSINCLLFLALGHRLTFRHHVVAHGAATLVGWFWVFHLCEACDVDPAIEESINRLGWVTDGVIQRISVLGAPIKRPDLERGAYSCWLVGLFYHLFLGAIIPSALVYVSEAISRQSFVAGRVDQRMARECKILKNGRLVLVVLATVVGSESLWFFMRAAFSLMSQIFDSTPTDESFEGNRVDNSGVKFRVGCPWAIGN